jgi:hypothetical protein
MSRTTECHILSIRDQSDCQYCHQERSVCINGSVREHCDLNNISDVEKFTTLTPLSSLFSRNRSSQIMGLKVSSLPSFSLKSSNRIFIWYSGRWSNTCYNSSQNLSFDSSLFFSLGACAFKRVMSHPGFLGAVHDILPLTNSAVLTANTIFSCTQTPVPNWWFPCYFT